LGKRIKINKPKFGNVFLSASGGFKAMQLFNNKIFVKERFGKIRPKRRTSGWRKRNNAKREAKWFLGRLRESVFKENVKLALKYRVPVLMICEKSLDVILFRSHFTSSIHKSKRLIAEGALEVNSNPIKKSGYRVSKGDKIRARRDLKSLRKVKKSITIFSSMSWNYKKRLWKRVDIRWWVPLKQPWRLKNWRETIPHYKSGLPQLKSKITEWLILPKDLLVDYKNLSLLVYKDKFLIQSYSKLPTNNFFKFKWKI
jgi:ribosomal protein S4